MNCKEGDLAVFVRSNAGNEGTFVTCFRIATAGDLEKQGYRCDSPVWVIDKYVKTRSGPKVKFASDAKLRPIRDTPGADETLSWKDVPQEVTA